MAQPLSPSKRPGDKGRRRSMRVLLTLAVKIRGTGSDGKKFEEETNTLVVNAHGALIALAAPAAQGQRLTITNKATQESLECTVVFIGHTEAGKTQAGIEFTEPSPTFWQINFPPEDWKTLEV